MTSRPWPPGTATGLGSLPGEDVTRGVRGVLDDAPDLPYLPELPARGLGADMVGRTGSLLVDLPLEWQPHGWTVTGRPGREGRAARDFLRRDLDAVTEYGQGLELLKVQVCGPMTLGATIELGNLHKVLTDFGAFRDLAGSLAEGVRRHVQELRDRLPGTRILLQVDEPALPAVLAGRVPTPSGYGTVRALDAAVAEPLLAAVLSSVEREAGIVHCCAADAPLELMRTAGAGSVSVDFNRLDRSSLDAIGELIESGTSLWLGVVPGTDTGLDFDSVRRAVLALWQRLGFDPAQLAESVVVTPACGLAGASEAYVRRAMSVLRDVGQALRD